MSDDDVRYRVVCPQHNLDTVYESEIVANAIAEDHPLHKSGQVCDAATIEEVESDGE